MKIVVTSFVSNLLTMILMDAVWLGIMYKMLYLPHMSHLLGDSPKIAPAALFYVIFAIALTFLVILPAIEKNSGYLNILFMGMLFGLVTYATYDLTNQATLKNWPVMVTVIDMMWGSIMTGCISVITTKICKSLI